MVVENGNKRNICVSVFPFNWSEVTEIAGALERTGISDIGIIDSPLVCRDLYVGCVASLLQTAKLRVQTAVTNPVTRHPSVTAGSALSLCELAPGRVVIGIATGDSAVWGVGLKPAKLAELREYIVALKALLRGEEANYRGSSFRGHWKDFDPALAPPIYVACSGPKTVKVSAQVADGLIIAEMGYTPEDITHIQALIKEGCAEVGRDPSELDVWWAASTDFSGDSVQGMATAVAGSFWITWGSTKGKRIPEGYVPKLRELHADSHNLATWESGRAAVLVERAAKLGVLDWLVARSARLYGSPADVKARMADLRELGVENWYLWPGGDDTLEWIDTLGTII